PAAGYFATANAMNIPAEPEYPREQRKLGFEWADPSRTDRIHEVLDAKPKSTLADSMALQTHSTSPQAPPAGPLAHPLTSSHHAVWRAIALLKAWDGAETTDSVAASIYETWTAKHLGRAVAAVAVKPAARALIGAGAPDPVITWLEAQPEGARAPILLD